MDRLRSDAINVQEPHFSGITRLVTYAAQLKWIGGKFPIDVSLYYIWETEGGWYFSDGETHKCDFSDLSRSPEYALCF